MEEPKFKNPNESLKQFDVEKYPVHNGFIYEIHFKNEEEAAKAVKSFWNTRIGTATSTLRGLESGMLKATKHQITSGDRTDPRKANSNDLQKHPDKPFVVQFNGNTDGLTPKSEDALRDLGFIE
jgi:hypothetical protein